MKVPKPSPADIERFRSLVPVEAEIKPLFGNLGAFVQGNMSMGLLGADIGLKLAPDHGDRLRSAHGGRPFGPPDRPMGGWVTLPAAMVGTPDAAHWVDLALAHVRTLPAKASKASRSAS